MSFYVITIIIEDESLVLVTEISNSYILLSKDKKNKITKKDDGTIVLPVGRNVYSFILSVYPNITKQNKDENNIFKNEYISIIQADSTSYDVKFIINEVVDIEYLDVIVTGKGKAQLIKCLEQIQETIFNSGVRDYYIDIVSYDSISEYYCNKILPKLNALERNLRKLLFNIYIVNFGKNYYQTTINKELQDKIKGVIKAKGNEEKKEIERLQQFFYSFEFNDIQKLLFSPNWTDLDDQEKKDFLDKNKDLSELSDEELRSAFTKISPKSDWERFFSSKINLADIEEMIDKIRQHRNNIAHFKFFYKDAYAESNKLINKLNTAIIKAIKLTEDKDFVEKNLEYFRKSMSEVFKAFEEFRKTMAQTVIPSIQALRNIVPPVLEQIRETYRAIDFSGFKRALLSRRDVLENQENELIECDKEDAETTNTETDSTKELNDFESEDEDNA